MPSANINQYLEKIAGQRAFSKGMRLHSQNKVRALQKNELLINAIVEDEQQFNVTLSLINDKYEGRCECEVSEGFDFCQHCVAVALADNTQEQALERLRNGGAKDRVEAYISGLSEGDAKAMLLDLMTKQTDELNKWQIIADISAKKANSKDIYEIINTALPVREVWRKERVKTYFDLAIVKLNSVHDILPRLPAEHALEIAEYALKRYDKVMGKIKDDKGLSLKVEYLFVQWLIQSSEACAWPYERCVSFLKDLYLNLYSHFTLQPVLSRFFPSDAEKKKAIVQALLEWRESLQAEQAARLKQDLHQYFMLKSDWEALVALHKDSVSNLDQSIELLAYCIKAGQQKSASALLDTLKAENLSPSQRTELKKLELAIQGTTSPSKIKITQLWDIFESSLESADLASLLHLLNQVAPDKLSHYKQRAEALARLKVSEATSAFSNDKLVAVLISTGSWQAAYHEAMHCKLEPSLLHQLAQKAITDDLDTGIALYRQLIMHYPEKTTHKDYMTAINLLNELRDALLIHSQNADTAKKTFDFLVSELNFEFKQKRKFLALLSEYFGL